MTSHPHLQDRVGRKGSRVGKVECRSHIFHHLKNLLHPARKKRGGWLPGSAGRCPDQRTSGSTTHVSSSNMWLGGFQSAFNTDASVGSDGS